VPSPTDALQAYGVGFNFPMVYGQGADPPIAQISGGPNLGWYVNNQNAYSPPLSFELWKLAYLATIFQQTCTPTKTSATGLVYGPTGVGQTQQGYA
jgi:hypothetical protein